MTEKEQIIVDLTRALSDIVCMSEYGLHDELHKESTQIVFANEVLDRVAEVFLHMDRL